MTALRFQTGGRHQTSPASLRGLCLRLKSQRRFQMLVTVCPVDIFRTTEHFVTKPDTVMQHHEPECFAEKLVHCVQPLKGGHGCLMSAPCLESQGCHLIPLCYLLSFFCLALLVLLFLSYLFLPAGSFFLTLSRKFFNIFC